MTDDDEMRAIGALLQSGQEAEARRMTRAALAAGRDGDAMLAFAGMLAARADDPADAAVHLEKLSARRPADRATRINLARAWIALEKFDGIAGLLRDQPSEPAIDRLRAYAALRLGEMPRARELYRAVVDVWRDDADSWANLAAAQNALGDHDTAIDSLEQAITLRDREPRFYLALADVLERADRSAARTRVMRDAAAVAPEDAAVQLALGLAESGADDIAAAEAAFRRAVALAPADPSAYLELGLLLGNHNRLDALDSLIADAASRIGDELALLRGWVAFRGGRIDEAAAWADAIPATVNARRRTHLQAQIADRRGDADAAFASFAAMNAGAIAEMPALAVPSYRATIVAETEALRAATIPPPLAADRAPPVFVVGFPRSGTTLLDTLLGRLPATHVLEEEPLIPTLQHELAQDARIGLIDAAATVALRRRYHEMVEERAPHAARGRIVDKHPLHMARMPLIDRLFPNAPILLVERHPYDVVLSCFMANFHLNHAMRSFVDLTEAALTYDAVFTAWSDAEERLDLRVHRVRYERLVADPEAEMRATLAFLDVAFDPAVLDNVAGARMRGRVKTASYSQVTEPIYQRAIARWERYRAQLAPVLPILAPWAQRMGYPT